LFCKKSIAFPGFFPPAAEDRAGLSDACKATDKRAQWTCIIASFDAYRAELASRVLLWGVRRAISPYFHQLLEPSALPLQTLRDSASKWMKSKLWRRNLQRKPLKIDQKPDFEELLNIREEQCRRETEAILRSSTRTSP